MSVESRNGESDNNEFRVKTDDGVEHLINEENRTLGPKGPSIRAIEMDGDGTYIEVGKRKRMRQIVYIPSKDDEETRIVDNVGIAGIETITQK